MADISFRTSTFTHGESIQEKYTCEGEDVSPELTIGDVPDDAAALAVVMDDPDAPGGTFTHWSLWNLPPDTVEVPEDVPKLDEVPELDGAKQGENDFGDVGYRGPCPPEGDDPHEYRFTLHVLDEELDVDPGVVRTELADPLEEATRETAQFTGTFGRE